ncbi:ATP-dependent RecD-like DNA helicase [Microcoleus sp. FACHB-1515]|uniref:ATP-dependent DNA helicase n=2 Tax=Cyanophyceae TaxID=3028117 RepID=UPI001A7E422B|nr:AAA family ATPase [Microcoleus sp. FACHB-1515]
MAFSFSMPVPRKTTKSIPAVLPGITLNPQQWQALQEMEKFVKSREKLHLLTGFAGTGKTTLLQALIKRLREKNDLRSIVFTAFSNKATKVLENMSSQWDLGIDCMTCCKLLGLKPELDPTTGRQIFKPDLNSENKFDKYRLIVVDEASMINEEMWLLLTQAVTDLHKKNQILFVGDVAQLPPINERESLVFSQIYERSDLTEVVRYGGSIALLAESIRNNLTSSRLPKFTTDVNDDKTEGVLVVDGASWEKLLVKAFQSKAYQGDPDYVRALAYTNARVDYLNRKIRSTIYGSQVPRFVIGERLVANSPFMVNDSLILQNASECEVIDIHTGKDGDWHVWYLHVLTDEGKLRNLTVLHELSQEVYMQKLAVYAEEKRWMEFWELKNLFADVNYAYCLTIHKSQGSTFQHVFVDVPNVQINRNVRERNQLLYVAVTRAAKRLFLYQ